MRHSSARFRRPVVAVLCTFGFSAQILAHDLWIEPSAFVLRPGNPISLRLRVGVDMIGDPVPRDPALIERFIAVDGEGTRPVPGADGVDPAGLWRVATPGLLVIGYVSRPSPIVLSAQKFNEYLAEEGLESIAALRAKRNETNQDAREEFSRCAKALLLSGEATTAQKDRIVGCTLELIAERNPYALERDELDVRLVYRDRPLSGALIVAINKRDPTAKISARSGKDGRATLRLADPGTWLIKAVHMTEAPAGSDAQWTSFWASLTFQIPPGAAGKSN